MGRGTFFCVLWPAKPGRFFFLPGGLLCQQGACRARLRVSFLWRRLAASSAHAQRPSVFASSPALVTRADDAVETKVAIRIEVTMEVLMGGRPPTPSRVPLHGTRLVAHLASPARLPTPVARSGGGGEVRRPALFGPPSPPAAAATAAALPWLPHGW